MSTVLSLCVDACTLYTLAANNDEIIPSDRVIGHWSDTSATKVRVATQDSEPKYDGHIRTNKSNEINWRVWWNEMETITMAANNMWREARMGISETHHDSIQKYEYA